MNIPRHLDAVDGSNEIVAEGLASAHRTAGAGYQGQPGSFGARAASRSGRPVSFPTFEKTLRAHTFDSRSPRLVTPRPARLENARRYVAGSGMRDQRLHARQPFTDERGNMRVAAVLAQQRLRMPQHEVGLVGPRQRRMAGEQ